MIMIRTKGRGIEIGRKKVKKKGRKTQKFQSEKEAC